ncbi:MAG: GH116 family glycosyl-hydrolase [Planctomycetota bacterium]
MSRHTDQTPYESEELRRGAPQREFSGVALREIAFPLGGIGTGCVSLGGRGQLRDWEIFNRPNRGYRPEFTFATLRAEPVGGEAVTKVLESAPLPPFSSTHGSPRPNGEGFPHMDGNTFRGEYPFAWLEFEDADLPLGVELEAFNPFIPRHPDESGLPVAVLTYRLRNTAHVPVGGFLAWTLQNVVGYRRAGRARNEDFGGNRNIFRAADGLNGFLMDSQKYDPDSPRFGTMALATRARQVTYAGNLGAAASFNTGHVFWDAVAEEGGFTDRDQSAPTPDGETAVCALGAKFRLEPGESAEIPFLLAWHFPNYHWPRGEDEEPAQWQNHYATRLGDAWEAAGYVNENLERLKERSLRYHGALYGSTLPAPALDAAGSQTSTLKTCTCLRLEDGTFYGFEGCSGTQGCCPGSCTHVWNYQQALPFLFPSLERSMRTADYRYNLRESDGRMCFRIGLPLGTSHWEFHAAADGQLGGMMKTYRDWLLCGDDEWLRELWPAVKKALSYAWEQWDVDRDGVPEGVQHNTYDIEFQGPNPLIGAFYMGALRAAEQMARHLGEEEQADRYRELYEKGSARMDEELFNGEYYVQTYDPEKVTTQQFGDGCLSDQMLGQWLASICDLGYLFEPENVRSALRSVFRYNWRPSLADHANPQRIYALGEEAGLLMASWPLGNRPLIPTRYCDEVWTGIEYQVASHLITEGFVDEGLSIVKGARERHDGRKRNPWDEPECGSHYARAMSSWGLVLALSGYFYDASRGLMRFAPKVHRGAFRCFWSNDAAWGVFHQDLDEGLAEVRLEVLDGEQELRVLRLQLDMPEGREAAAARLGDERPACSAHTEGEWTELRFEEPVTVGEGRTLTVRLEG